MRTRTSTLRVPRASLEIFMRASIMQLDAPQLAMRRTEQIAWYCIWYPGVRYGGSGDHGTETGLVPPLGRVLPRCP